MTVVGPPRSGKGVHLVIPWTVDAPGAVVVPSTKPDTLGATIAARRCAGPVDVFDPQGLAAGSETLRWAPQGGCHDPLVAILRARALTAGSKVGVGVENGDFWSAMTQAVLRCYLHAAALDGRDIRQVLRWSGAPSDSEPVRILRNMPGAADGWAEELEEQASADPRQRGSVWAGVRRALDSLADPRILAACSPCDGEEFEAETFLRERGTLYLLGSTGAQLSVAPLITALIEDVTERARTLAARSPGGRLDPPLLLLLDEVANIAPLPSLPSLLADGGGVGIPTVAVLQSLAQARSRWGSADSAAMWDASTIKIVLGGLGQADDLDQLARLSGERAPLQQSERTKSQSRWTVSPA
jgi:type IV secretory pathway TraG/TraD family ATPase VirD4